jgi:hypothetical protein
MSGNTTTKKGDSAALIGKLAFLIAFSRVLWSGIWTAFAIFRPSPADMTPDGRESARRNTSADVTAIQAAPKAKSKGSCPANYTQWAEMPDGKQKAAKLVYWKKAYGTLNFHDNCVGEPRRVLSVEAIQ